jgi:Fe-S oxidoreductase
MLLPRDQDANRLSKRCYLLSEFLEKVGWHPPHLARMAMVHGHCHHKAVVGIDAEKAQLDKLGIDYQLLDSGCCSMAGAFGFERAHYDLSQAVGEHELLPAVRAADKKTLVVTDGFSCREQIRQNTDRQAVHFAEMMQMALQPTTAPAPAFPERQLVGRLPRPAHVYFSLLAFFLVLISVVWVLAAHAS